MWFDFVIICVKCEYTTYILRRRKSTKIIRKCDLVFRANGHWPEKYICILRILNNRTKCGISKRFHMKSKYGLRWLIFLWLYREHKYLKLNSVWSSLYYSQIFFSARVSVFFLFSTDSSMKENYEKWFRFYVFAFNF